MSSPLSTPPEGKASKSRSAGVPVLIYTAFIISCICIGGSIAIICTSDGKMVGNWIDNTPSVQPSVLLAIFTGISNTCFGVLLSGGIAITWWRALIKGTTLKELHHIWNKGEWGSVRGWRKAVSSSPAVLKIVIAFVLVSFASLASNPLLQRSCHSVLNEAVSQTLMYLAIPKTIPDGWTGQVDHAAPASLWASSAMGLALQDWYSNKTIQNPYPKFCQGTCKGTVAGAGISVLCSHTQKYLDLSSPENANLTLFSINFTRFDDSTGTPTLLMMVIFTSNVDGSCNATINIETCNIHSAIVSYDVVVQNDTMTVDLDSMPMALSLNKSRGDSVSARQDSAAGVLAGLEWMGYYYLQSNATLDHNNTDGSYSDNTIGILANQYDEFDQADYSSYADCAFQFRNATDDLIKYLHEVVFRFALYASNGTYDQLINMTISEQVLEYKSNWSFLVAGVVVMFAALLSTILLLRGYSDIGRPVSLNPLETAPALTEIMCKTPIREIGLVEAEKLVKEAGDTKVQLKRYSQESRSAE
ncbi:hypothetical protein BP6252_13347 [Coleophoma cylindrospora]|uniref:Uncharacterized protein n=1 Tax=Coleophoma cylindrospora TaxID=1849047 RepID=A0A3D8QAR8_9HELO|nr:hypothetical protein BP6252_13347 [Coleophoma cylindrospora]